MKKGMFALLMVVCLPAWSLDWELPIFTLRYEIMGGESEDPDDDTLQPSSRRDMVTFHVKEAADPAVFGLTLTFSAKDYFQQSGDYSYLKAEHDASVRLGDMWKLGYLIGAKWMEYAQLDSKGLSKNALSLNAGGTATFTLVRGTSLEAGFAGRYALAENPADAAQTYVATTGLSSRLGEWLLAARYRGEFRSPFGAASSMSANAYNTGSVSLQWDPNR